MNRNEAISRASPSTSAMRGWLNRLGTFDLRRSMRPLRGVWAVAVYQLWIVLFDRVGRHDRRLIERHVATRTDLPRLLVILRFNRASEPYAQTTFRSLKSQWFVHWSAVVILDPSCTTVGIGRIETEAERMPQVTIAKLDPRGTLLRGGDGPIIFIEGGVRLRKHALYSFAAAAADHPHSMLIYADEDRLNRFGLRCQPFFKPRFSPALAAGTSYFGPVVLIREACLSPGAILEPDAYVHQTLSRLLLAGAGRPTGETVLRLPFILYDDALAPRQELATESRSAAVPDALPRVTIIVPTRNRADLLGPCLRSVESLTDYPRSKIEIIVVDNGSAEPRALELLAAIEQGGGAKIIRDKRPFNFSEINNAAVEHAGGEILVFLNDDTEIVSRNWLRRLVEYAVQEGVGAVGARLIYADRRLQHAGIVLGTIGGTEHAHKGLRWEDPGYFNLVNRTREVSAVTGACLAVRTEVFRAIGGFDPRLRVAFNDVMFCLDLIARGYRNLYVADAILIHHESKSRGIDRSPAQLARYRGEAEYVVARHPGLFADDPYYNPNLSKRKPYRLGFPPRAARPWRLPSPT